MTDGFPEPEAPIKSVEPEGLKAQIDEGEEVFLLDTRATEEFEQWHIDGESVDIVNIPYFEFLADDFDDELIADLPENQTITVVCAKGGSSEYIAGILAERGYDVNHLARGMQGWAGIYEVEELDRGTDATILQYQRPSSGCLAYLVVDGDEAAVIDPLRAFTDRYVTDADERGSTIEYAFDTHIHADHVSGVRTLAAETNAEAVLPAPAAERGVEYDRDYRTVKDGAELTVGDTTIEVIHTPGHTTGMTAYHVENVLFTGDGLFTESVARPDLEDGDEGASDAAGLLYETLQERVLALPVNTVIAPSHFSDSADSAEDDTYTARLGALNESMDALSMERDEFVEFVLSDMPPRPANYEEIIETNLGQQESSDEEAFTLELGPNNCAASQEALTEE